MDTTFNIYAKYTFPQQGYARAMSFRNERRRLGREVSFPVWEEEHKHWVVVCEFCRKPKHGTPITNVEARRYLNHRE
jgi:hypothetical protein